MLADDDEDADAEARRRFNGLDEEQRRSLRAKTCNKASAVEVLGVVCPDCRKPKRKRCLLKAGDWPPEDMDVDDDDDAVMEEVAQHVLSPRRAGAAAANATTGKRVSRRIDILTGTPRQFRDWRTSRRSRSLPPPKKEEACFDLAIVEDVAESLGVQDEQRVDLLRRIYRALASLDEDSTESMRLTEGDRTTLTRLLEHERDQAEEEEEEDDVDEQEEEESPPSLSEICRFVLPQTELAALESTLKKSADAIGIKDDCVSDMNYDRRRHLSRIVATLVNHICRIAKAGKSDAKGVFGLVADDRRCKPLQDKGDEQSREEILKNPVVRNIASSYRIAKRTKEERLARQLLSLLVVSGLRDQDIIDVCSEESDLAVGSLVRVLEPGGKGRQYRLAKITAVNDVREHDDDDDDDDDDEEGTSIKGKDDGAEPTYDVQYFELGASEKKKRFATLGQSAVSVEEAFAAGTITLHDGDEKVVRRRIKAANAVYCTRDAIWKAKIHARSSFPGNTVTKTHFTRIRVSDERALELARTLRPGGGEIEYADASNKNVARGVKYVRLDTLRNMHKRLLERLSNQGLAPISWPTFRFFASTKDTVNQKAETCCCPTCRDMGYGSFDEIASILDALVESAAEHHPRREEPSFLSSLQKVVDKLKKRADAFHRYLRCEFMRSLKEQDPNARFCARHALTTACNPNFIKQCTHTRGDGSLGALPPTMAETIRKERDTPADVDFWEGTCDFCGRGGKLHRCNECECSAHADCIKMHLNDYDPTKANCVSADGADGDLVTGWRCLKCQHVHDESRHSNDSPDINEMTWLLDDVRHLINVAVPAGTGKPPPASPPTEAPETTAVTATTNDSATVAEFADDVGLVLQIQGTWWQGGTGEERAQWWEVEVTEHEAQHNFGRRNVQEGVLLACLDGDGNHLRRDWCQCRGNGKSSYAAVKAAWLKKKEADDRNARLRRSTCRQRVNYDEQDDDVDRDEDDDDNDDDAEEENDSRGANVNDQPRKRPRDGDLGSPGGELDDRGWLLHRIENVVEHLEAYTAHQLRTWKFKQGQPNNIERVKNDPTAFFQLSDYFGKIKPRKSMEATCEGMQSGISIHGSTIILQNPPQSIRDEYTDVDWSLWPPPPEKPGSLLVINSRIICDDSRQNPFSVRAVMETQCAKLSEEAPWLRLGLGQSDQCGDFHSTQSIFAFAGVQYMSNIQLRIVEHSYTEAGEGKNWVDADCGRAKMKLMRDRNLGHDHESASEIHAGLERHVSLGEWHAVIELDRSREERKNTAPAISDISDYQHIEFPDDGSVIFRECAGYGPGRKLTKDELEPHDQHKLDDRGGTGTSIVESSKAMRPAPHNTAETRHDEREKKKRRRAAATEKAEAKRSADEAAIAAEQGGGPAVFTCKACDQRLLSAAGFHRHRANGCTKATKRELERKVRRPTVAALMNSIDDAALADIRKEHDELTFVDVMLTKQHGLTCHFRGDALVVTRIATPTASFELVGKGYEISQFGDIDVAAELRPQFDEPLAAEAAADALLAHLPDPDLTENDNVTQIKTLAKAATLAVAKAATLAVAAAAELFDVASAAAQKFVDGYLDKTKARLRRADPPVPPHGWARKALRRQPQIIFRQEQKDFLDRLFESSLHGNERMREKKVFELMKKEFGRKLDAGGRTLALNQTQIRGYFSRRASALKRTAVDNALNSNVDNNAADADARGEGEPLAVEEASEDYDNYTCAELKEMLKVRGLTVGGKKTELIARLKAAEDADN